MEYAAKWLTDAAAIVQYGMASAAAVFLFVAFLLLGAQRRWSSSRSKTLTTQSFMRLCAWAMAFSLAGAAFDALKDRVPSIAQANERTIARLQRENAEVMNARQELQAENARLEALAGSIGHRLESELRQQQAEHERAMADLQRAFDDEKEARRMETERQSQALERQKRLIEWSAARRIEDSWAEALAAVMAPAGASGGNGGGSGGDTYNRALRRAVFLSVPWFDGRDDALRSSLERLKQRDPRLTDELVERVAREWPKIRADRHRWLKERAMPSLQRDISYLKSHPLEQRAPRATVDLPKEYQVAPEVSSAPVTELWRFEDEIRKLEETSR